MAGWLLNLQPTASDTGGQFVDTPVVDSTTRSAAQPFTAVWCQPSYADRKTLVEWTVMAGYEAGQIYVYRSLTGSAPWTCLNADDPAPVLGNYEDDVFTVDNVTQLAYYRLMLEHENVRYGSPAIHLLQTLTKSQYGASRLMLIKELRSMVAGNGIEVYHFPLLPGRSDDIDSRTSQKVGVPCPSDGLSGFAHPLKTWIRMGSTKISMNDRPEGDGADIDVTMPARMLSFPRPVRGNIIVDPISDDRYAVDSIVDAHRFRGIVAIAYDVSLRLLDRRDERYRLEVPSLL